MPHTWTLPVVRTLLSPDDRYATFRPQTKVDVQKIARELADGLIPETAHWQAAELRDRRARVTSKSQNAVALRQNPATRAKALRRS